MNSSQANKSDLAQFIATAPFIDTHEHLETEAAFSAKSPDVLLDLFGNYVTADLAVAGAKPNDVQRLINPASGDVRTRFVPVQQAWEACQFTGYGEAVRWIASHFYGMNEITPDALEAAQPRADKLRQPGTRLKLLQEAGIEHVQIDNFEWKCEPDLSGADFFLYDISWVSFCRGEIDAKAIYEQTGVEIRDLDSLRAAMSDLFEKYGKYAIAVKSQHAYSRTLHWGERDEAQVSLILSRVLAGEDVGELERNVLGDWCMARGVELAQQHNLPFKIHTGYYAGHSYLHTERIPSGLLCGLLRQYPDARFVLMHIAYPYTEEIIALAKHFPNVWIDLCWAWSINPFTATDWLRRFIREQSLRIWRRQFSSGGFSRVCVAGAAGIDAGIGSGSQRRLADGKASSPSCRTLHDAKSARLF
jgi:uncharacterized protein